MNFEAVKTIHSDNDLKRVLTNVIDHEAAKPALLLVIAAAKASTDSAVRSALRRACGKASLLLGEKSD